MCLPLVLPLLIAQPGEAAAFERALAGARPIASVGRFLEEVLGDCRGEDPLFDRDRCLAEAQARLETYTGQLLRLELSDLAGHLSAPEWHPERRAFRVLWTPIIGARGLGLSVGRPRRLDRAGNPVVGRLPLWVERPPGTPEFIFRRNLERGMVALELLVEVDRPWRLRRPSGLAARGLSVRLRGWRLRSRQRTLGADLTTDDG